jgi:threonine/homoserine efflux transporter RhtA
VAALIGLIVLQESLHASQWIAVLCVVAASAGATRGADRAAGADRPPHASRRPKEG